MNTIVPSDRIIPVISWPISAGIHSSTFLGLAGFFAKVLAFGESAVVEAASLEVVVVQAAEPPAVEQENPKVE